MKNRHELINMMNTSREDMTTIVATLFGSQSKQYVFNCPHSLSKHLKINSRILVEVRTEIGYAVGVVKEIHDYPEYPADNVHYNWVLNIVDERPLIRSYEQAEDDIAKRLGHMQRARQRKNIAEALGIGSEELIKLGAQYANEELVEPPLVDTMSWHDDTADSQQSDLGAQNE